MVVGSREELAGTLQEAAAPRWGICPTNNYSHTQLLRKWLVYTTLNVVNKIMVYQLGFHIYFFSRIN